MLVELYNKRLLAAGLIVVGTLAYMALLNEMGVVAVVARTEDIDLARRQALKLAAPLPFLETVQATQLNFFPVTGMPQDAPSTSVKRPGKEGLRVDVLTSGPTLGRIVPVREIEWHAQTVPHYDYLLLRRRRAAMLAGGHCIPLTVPAPERFVWHKLYSSASRTTDRVKAGKDLRQAATLAAILIEHDDMPFAESVRDVPAAILKAARSRLSSLRALLQAHPQALAEVERALS